MKNPIIIVGAGAAGIGMGVLLKRLELPFVIIEKTAIGASFLRWPNETRFISPSFTGNAFGAVDLNAVTPDSSPAFSLRTEHPSGREYTRYLEDLAMYFKLPIKTDVEVNAVYHDTEGEHHFVLETSLGNIGSDHLIWAAGEFAYPNRQSFLGAHHCQHYADIKTWSSLDGEHFTVIGGYESGVDAAYQLAKLGKQVVLFDAANQLQQHGSDSSYFLSPFTRQRFNDVQNQIEVINASIAEIRPEEDGVVLKTADNKSFLSPTSPINCTGFSTSLSLVKDLFDFTDGHVQLNKYDESTLCPNLFLVGPQVRHAEAIFCFIYKFRQRFGIVGETLSERILGDEDIRTEVINYYRHNQFYLDDLACCDEECVC